LESLLAGDGRPRLRTWGRAAVDAMVPVYWRAEPRQVDGPTTTVGAMSRESREHE
jgi:hypothetical protein